MTDLELFYAHKLVIDFSNATKNELVKLDEIIKRCFPKDIKVCDIIERVNIDTNRSFYLHSIDNTYNSLRWSYQPEGYQIRNIDEILNPINITNIEDDDWKQVYV